MINACHLVAREDRLRIVRLVDEQSNDPQLVADMFGVDRSFVHELLHEYRTAGPDSRCYERSPGRPPAISEQQLGDLYLLLRNQAPRKFGIRLSGPTVAKILNELGLRTGRNLSSLCSVTTFDATRREKIAQRGAKILVGYMSRVARGLRFGGGEPDVPDARRFIDFGVGLLRESSKPVLLIVQRRSGLDLVDVQEFVKKTRGRLQLFFLSAGTGDPSTP